MKTFDHFPVIEPSAAIVEEAKPVAPVFYRGIQLELAVAAAKEEIDLAQLPQVGQQFHGATDMSISCGLDGIKDFHAVEF
jgi:hypothetical protein